MQHEIVKNDKQVCKGHSPLNDVHFCKIESAKSTPPLNTDNKILQPHILHLNFNVIWLASINH